MVEVRRLVSAGFETADASRLSDYYTEILGLNEAGRQDGKIFLSAGNDLHSVVLTDGSRAHCGRFTFQVGPGDDLEEVAHSLKATGVETDWRSDPEPTVNKALRFEDPNGVEVLLIDQLEDVPVSFGDKGIVPMKLGHIGYLSKDFRKVIGFYKDVLGFRISDEIDNFMMFMRCGPDHHSMNFINSDKIQMHHIAFELLDADHMFRSCDVLGYAGYKIIWGPGRHLRSHNIFTYHRNPDGQIIELYTQMDQMDEAGGFFEPRPWHAKRPHRPGFWQRNPNDTNLWGQLPPHDFLDG